MLEAETSNLLLMAVEGGGGASATGVARGREDEARAPEAALVEAVRDGDREAFAGLYQLFAPLVHGVLLARVPYGEVGDLTQDVFLVAFRKIGSLRDTARFGPWVAMIARNRAMDFHRQRRETDEITEESARTLGPPRAEAEEALAAIRSLPEAYRETLVLRLVEGMTGPEIAERTGLQADSVRVNLHRGMKLLRERLGVKGRES